jgi:TldD protein
VRAVSGEKTAFAYSDDISSLRCWTPRAGRARDRRAGQSRAQGARRPQGRGSRSLYAPLDPIATLDSAQKVALLERLEQLARARDPRVTQVMAAWPANTTWCWSRAPTACWPPTCGRWCGCRSR